MGFTDGARVGARVSLYCYVRINLVNTDGATDIWTDVWDYGRPSKTPSVARSSAVGMEYNNDGRETRRSSRPTLLRHQHVPPLRFHP